MRKSWPNTTDITVAGTHFIQERSADEIGAGIANWYAGLC
jgi:haloalkane dehalogenase